MKKKAKISYDTSENIHQSTLNHFVEILLHYYSPLVPTNVNILLIYIYISPYLALTYYAGRLRQESSQLNSLKLTTIN